MNKMLVLFDFDLCYAFGKSYEVLSEEQYRKVVEFSISGEDIYLGEIAGKHSEVYGPLETENFKIVSTDQKYVQFFEEVIGQQFGAFDVYGTICDQEEE